MLKDSGIAGTISRAARSKGFIFAVIGLFAGLMLILIPGKTNDPTDAADEAPTRYTAEEYCALLEQKAESLINELEGVSGCKVVITLSEGYRYVYATDQHVSEQSSAESYSKQTDKTIVLAENDGNKNPSLISETMPAVAGVAVVCRGAGYETQYRIIELMCALFDIKSNRISVQS